MTKKISIPYFPGGLKYITPIFFGAGIYLAVEEYPVWGVLLILMGAAILTTKYVTEIDLNENVYHDYISMIFIPLDKESKQFNALDRIVIAKGDYAQTVNTRAQSRQFEFTDFTATLVFDDGDTLDLLTKNSKKELVVGLKEFVDFLQVGVEDRSGRDFYWVDMSKVKTE